MLFAHQFANLCQQHFGTHRFERRVGERRAADEVGTVEHVGLQGAEAAALVKFGVSAALDHVGFEVGENRLVGLGPVQQSLDDFHGFGHIFSQSRNRDAARGGAGLH